MKPKSIDLRENARLDDLYSYQILDTEAEKDFDELVELASDIAGTPISLISLVDKDRQWFKANKGLPVNQTSRNISFCAHAIEVEEEDFIIGDTTKDEQFADNSLVTSDPNIRFYAGFPLLTQQGHKLGTLCVMDKQPRTLSPKQTERLQRLAKQAMKLLELHKAHKELQIVREKEARQNEVVQRLLDNQRKIVAILAHDTRGPLYSMKNLLNMFVQGQVLQEDAQNLHEMMYEQTDVTINMIESLVKWGEIHLKAIGENGSASALNDIIAGVFKQYASSAATKGITLFDDVSEIAMISINNEMLGFIVRNLVNNAIKYTENGEIRVSGSRKNNHFILTVSDTGVGMSDMTKQSLFLGKFSSLSGTRKETGSGLGLMLINDFVQQASGTITIESELYKGTSISISLPCR